MGSNKGSEVVSLGCVYKGTQTQDPFLHVPGSVRVFTGELTPYQQSNKTKTQKEPL
jgi:hypothetical protein